jgi:hypothetical protein
MAEKRLTELANQIAADAQARTSHIQAELLEIEKQKVAKQAELDFAHLSLKRALKFQPKIGRDYQCPRCWINSEVRSALTAIPFEIQSEDLFGAAFAARRSLFPLIRFSMKKPRLVTGVCIWCGGSFRGLLSAV